MNRAFAHPGTRLLTYLLALALAVSGLTVLLTVATSQPAHAADPVICSVTNPLLVNQQSEGTDVQNKTNTLQYYDTQTAAITGDPIVNLNNVNIPNIRPNGIDEEINGLALSADGTKAYFTSHYLDGNANAPTGGSYIYEYDIETGNLRAWKTAAVPTSIATSDNHRVRRGAVDPTTGIFYYGTSNANGTIQYLYAIDPTASSPQAWYVGTITTPTATGVSGDIAFDAAGQMFIVTGSDSAAYVNVVDGELPTSPDQGQVNLGVRNLSTITGTGNGAGIAYGLDGYLYVSNTAGQFFRVDPSTGAVVASLGSIGGSGASVDLATCTFPSTLTVVKDVTSKVYAADQFTISAARANGTSLGTATTTGPAGTARATLGPIPIPTTATDDVYTISEALASGSGSADLSQYGTHLTCVDTANGNKVLVDENLTGNANRSDTVTAHRPDGSPGYQAILCTFTNRDIRPARLVLTKSVENPPDDDPTERFAVQYPAASGTSPRADDSFSASDAEPIGGEDGLTFQPYSCTEGDKHVFSDCKVDDIDGNAGNLDFNLASLGADPAGVLQFQEQLTQDQIDDGWRRVGAPSCTSTNTNPNAPGTNLDTLGYQVAVGSVAPGTTITCNQVNTRNDPTWTIAKRSNPTSGTAADPAPVQPGGTIAYTLHVENPTDVPVDGAVVRDDLSNVLGNGVTLEALDDPPTGSATVSGSVLTWNVGTLAAGASYDYVYRVKVAESTKAYGLSLHNSVTGTSDDGPPESCSAAEPCSTYHATPDPDWTITKATETGTKQDDGAYLTTPGFPVVYSITVDNTNGQVPLYGVHIDDGPVGGTPDDIWNHATWDGTFDVQMVTPQRYTSVVPYDEHTDDTPANGLQYTFDQPIPAGAKAVITFTLTLDSDFYQGQVRNVVQGGLQGDDDPDHAPADCWSETEPTDTSTSCVVVHETRPGTLTLVKTTEPSGYEDRFTLSADSGLDPDDPPLDNVPTSMAGTSGSPAVTDQPVYSGTTYTISESVNTGDPDNWTNEAWACSAPPIGAEGDDDETVTTYLTRLGTNSTTTLVIQSGQDMTCRITNVAAGATLKLAKQLDNNHGGTASPTQWRLTARAGDDDPVINSEGSKVSETRAETDTANVGPGATYTLSETGNVAGYQPHDPAWACVDTADNNAPVSVTDGDQVTPDFGQNLVCTVTNVDLPGIITVTKYGPASADPQEPLAGADFTLWKDTDSSGTIDPDVDTVAGQGTSGADGQVQWTGLDWGDYLVQETAAPDGYAVPDPHVWSLTVNGGDTTGDGATLSVNDPDVAPWTLSKESDPPSGQQVNPGQVITYTIHADRGAGEADPTGLTITDDLSRVLNNASFVAGSIAPSVGDATRDGNTITWTIPALSANATLTYQVRVNGDAYGVTLANQAAVPDDAPQPQPCPDESPNCRTTTHTTPTLAPWSFEKTSSPADGSTVQPGQQIDYTITVTRGAGEVDPSGVVITDNLSDVLDNATYVPSSINPSQGTAEFNESGTAIVWDVGTLDGATGATFTLTFSVTVDAGSRGDVLDNVATGTGGTDDNPQPPEECEVEGCHETVHQTPDQWTLVKTSDPEDGSTVRPGDSITYTLTATPSAAFRSTPTALTITDDLSDVEQYADLNQATITASDGTTATYDPATGHLTWEIEALTGTVKVSYTVTVHDGAWGVSFGNVATASDSDPPPDDCPAANPTCLETEHSTPATWTFHKSSQPPTGSTVQPGDQIVYTLTVDRGDTGGDPRNLTITDDLTDVLDNATFVAGSIDPSLGTAERDGNTLTWTIPRLDADTATLTYAVTVNSGQWGVELTNLATGSGSPADPDDPDNPGSPDPEPCPNTNPDCRTTTQLTPAPWTVAKTSVPADGTVVQPGSTITYTLTVDRGDGEADPTGVVITDDLSGVLNHATMGTITAPGGTSASVTGNTLTWHIGALSGDLTLTYTVTVDEDAYGVTLRNLATGSATGGPPPTDCAEGSQECSTTHRTPASWTLSKSSDPVDGTVQPGDTITYTLHANRGTGEADPTGLTITDDLSRVLNNASFVSGSITPSLGTASRSGTTITWHIPALSADATLTYKVRVDAGAYGVTLTNQATVPTDDPQPAPCDQCTTTTTHDTPTLAPWQLVKSSDPPSGQTVQTGDTITYTLTATRGAGDVDPTDIVVSDNLSRVLNNADYNNDAKPSQGTVTLADDNTLTWNVGRLSGTATLTYSVTVHDDARGVELVNTASTPSGSPQPEDCPDTNPRCRTTVHQTPNDWTLVKSSDPVSGAVVQPGDTITYTLTATPRAGATAPVDVVVSDDLSGVLDDADYNNDVTASTGAGTASIVDGRLTWTIGTLNEVETVTYSVTVHDDAWGATLTNVATVDSGDPPVDTCPEANPDCRTTTHKTPATWTLSKSSDPASGSTVRPGDTITYTLHADRGEDGADPSDLVITDDLSRVLNNASFVRGSITPSLGTALRRGSTITWHIPALSADATLSYKVKVNAGAHGVRLVNVASVPDDAPQPLPCPDTNTGCRTTSHHTPGRAPATWTVVKSSDPASGSSVRPGAVITYTVTATLLSGVSADDLTIVDDLSDVLDEATWIDGSVRVSAGRAARSGNRLTWRIPALTGTQTMTYRVRVAADAANATLHNVVTADGAEPCGATRAAVSRSAARSALAPSVSARAVVARDLSCRETEHSVSAASPEPSGPVLPNTGGPSLWWAVGGMASLLAGLGLVLTGRRRRSR